MHRDAGAGESTSMMMRDLGNVTDNFHSRVVISNVGILTLGLSAVSLEGSSL